jgi:WD40 repeat protein
MQINAAFLARSTFHVAVPDDGFQVPLGARLRATPDLRTCCSRSHLQLSTICMQGAWLSTEVDGGSSQSHGLLGARIGPYEILRLLGRGGMGEVYLARDLRLGRLVAVKLLTTQRSDLDERFLTEAQATARCHHENIVVIHEVGAHGGRPYMVLEYLEGQTLRQWLRDHMAVTGPPARVSPTRAVELMLPVVRALAYAHDQGIVHRDLKPENVMLTRAGVIKVLDFGVAKRVAMPAVDPGPAGDVARLAASSSSLAGTRPYMSPEQMTLGVIDQRADVWAAGIMLFELAAGAHPLAQAGVALTATIPDAGAPMPSARERLPELGPLAEIIDRCLIRDPAHRTPSARVLLAELEALVPGRRSIDRWLTVVRWLGGHRMRRRLFRGLLAAAIAVAMIMAWLVREQTAARRQAVALASAAATEAIRARDAARMAAVRALPDDPTTQLALLREIEDVRAPPPGAAQEARRLLHADVALVVLTGSDALRSAAFSPDGRRVVFGSDDANVWVWNADGGGVPVSLRGHGHHVASTAFSSDGRRIVSASNDRTVRVWNADGGGEPVVLRGHDDGVWSAAFSPDGRRVVSGSYDKTVRVWNTDGSGAPLVLRGHQAAVVSVTYSPDGQRVASASWDRTVRVWNADGSGEPVVLRGHGDRVMSVAFSPDGRRIVSASCDRTVRVWNADGSGEPVVLRGHDDRVMAAVFSPDGRRIASAGLDKTVRMWSAEGRALFVLRGHDERVSSVAFSPDGDYLVSASNDRTVRIWNAAPRDAPSVLRGHDDAVGGVAFSPDDRRIASASADRTVRVWSADGSGEPVVLHGHQAAVGSVVFSPDGRRIASTSDDRTVRVWNADGSGAPLILRGHDAEARFAAFSPDGKRIVTASGDRTVRVWSAEDGSALLVLRGHDETVDTALFSPDGERIVSASWDRTVRVWNADGSGDPVVLRGHDNGVRAATFSPDGRRVVSAAMDGTVRVWSADGRGEPIILRGHDGWVFWAEFSPDGRRIVSSSRDKTIRIWQADGTGEPIVLRGHDLPVTQARFSTDGRRIVSASMDHTVRVWDDLGPIGLDDPRLWMATSYCMPVERRIELLAASAEQARRDRQRCVERVARTRAPLLAASPHASTAPAGQNATPGPGPSSSRRP